MLSAVTVDLDLNLAVTMHSLTPAPAVSLLLSILGLPFLPMTFSSPEKEVIDFITVKFGNSK